MPRTGSPRVFVRWGRRTAFMAAALLVGLAGLELSARAGLWVAVRLALPSPEARAFVTSTTQVYDPELGWRPASASSSLTLTDPLAPAQPLGPRRPGERRGFAFGDSQTVGLGVAPFQAWPGVAEADLRAAGVDVTLVNLGSPGYRSAQAVVLLERAVLAESPDFLVMDFMADDSPPLVRDYHPELAPLRAVLFESRLYRLLWLGVARARGENLGAVGNLHLDPQARDATRGAGNFGSLVELARLRHIPILFLDYPYIGGPAHALCDRAAVPDGAAFVETVPALLASGLSTPELFTDRNHLTVAGSALVGHEVAHALQGLLPAR